MMNVGVVDYGVGNLRSVSNALRHLNATPVISDDPDCLSACDSLIFPGVGAFSYGIEALKSKGLDQTLKSAANQKTPILGICLGMQLLLDRSYEFGEHAGLGIMQGKVEPFDAVADGPNLLRLPNVGWLPVAPTDADYREYDWLFHGNSRDTHYYFVHSFRVKANNPDAIASSIYEQIPFAAVVASGSIIGTQFHPEKSGPAGLQLLKNFLNWRPAT